MAEIQKAVIEIIHEQPEEIKVTEAKGKRSPGICTQSLGQNMTERLHMQKSSVKAETDQVRFTVQFNPAKLQAAAEGETEFQSYIRDAAGSGNRMQSCQMSSRVRVNFTLVFDDTDKEKTTVRQKVEGFMAAIRDEHTRKVNFIWGNLRYSGVLSSVQAVYTMFRPDGSPVHAEVQVGLLCMDENQGEREAERWKQRYQNLVKNLKAE
ncbi:MAG: hypothetical protein HFI70_12845 [Lachnospiraceae bacterium]|nr:hypothetical protein [Lachnospiraceae bacterium]